MDSIYNMNINFLMQASRVLETETFDQNELELITNFLLAADEDLLSDLYNTCTILSYDNDLDFFHEILDLLLVIHEEKEEYEICEMLKYKIDDIITIKTKKTI